MQRWEVTWVHVSVVLWEQINISEYVTVESSRLIGLKESNVHQGSPAKHHRIILENDIHES